MRMNSVSRVRARTWLSKSSPLRPGILMSEITRL